MKTRIQKWGNSLALRIPKAFARETALDSGAEVDLSVEDGRLVITPLEGAAFSLEGLLAGVTAENLHGEVGTGEAVGSEEW